MNKIYIDLDSNIPEKEKAKAKRYIDDIFNKKNFNHLDMKVLYNLGYDFHNSEFSIIVDKLTNMYQRLEGALGEFIDLIPYGGTQLGLFRQNGLIKHDDDLDFIVDYTIFKSKFQEIKAELSKSGFTLWENSEIINKGFNHEWNNVNYWTKIIDNSNIFKVKLGDTYFKFKLSIDIFPLYKFNKISEYSEFIKTYFYSIPEASFKRAYKKHFKKRIIMQDLISIKVFVSRCIVKKAIKKRLKMYKSKNFQDDFDVYLNKLNDLYYNNKNKETKYFSTFDSNLIFQRFKSFDNFKRNYIENINISVILTGTDKKDIIHQFGYKWKNETNFGHSHLFVKENLDL